MDSKGHIVVGYINKCSKFLLRGTLQPISCCRLYRSAGNWQGALFASSWSVPQIINDYGAELVIIVCISYFYGHSMVFPITFLILSKRRTVGRSVAFHIVVADECGNVQVPRSFITLTSVCPWHTSVAKAVVIKASVMMSKKLIDNFGDLLVSMDRDDIH